MKQCMVWTLCIVIGLLSVGEVDATVWYVHPDSTLNSIQAGLDLCSVDDTVLVAPSTYYENLNWPNTQSIVLTSESGPSTTIIDGDSTGDAPVIIIDTGIDSTTIIDGFTIQNGYNITGSVFGGGIACIHSSPTIINNIITKNGSWAGSGIYCDSSSAIITGNFIVYNIGGDCGGGIACTNNSSLTITDNTISYNDIYTFSGGGIYCSYSSASISGNVIAFNSTHYSGAGIECIGDTSSVITITDNDINNNVSNLGCGGIYIGSGNISIADNTIMYNSGGYSGGIECNGDLISIVNNTISYNISVSCGGGIRCNYGSATILNNTITDNAALHGSGIYCYNSSPLIQMCDISFNNGDGIYCESMSNPAINYNNINDNTDYGVLNADPIVTIDAEYNWWGDPSGPGGVGPGTGDEVSENVLYDPWLTEMEIEEGIPSVNLGLTLAPNPFSASSIISFETPVSGYAVLQVFDLSGRLIETLVAGDLQNGSHSIALTSDGYGSGVYLIRLQFGSTIQTERCVLLR